MGTYTFQGNKETVKVHTTFVYPPLPVRHFDWHCIDEDYDGAPDAGPQLVGTGATEIEAIYHYLEQYLEREE